MATSVHFFTLINNSIFAILSYSVIRTFILVYVSFKIYQFCKIYLTNSMSDASRNLQWLRSFKQIPSAKYRKIFCDNIFQKQMKLKDSIEKSRDRIQYSEPKLKGDTILWTSGNKDGFSNWFPSKMDKPVFFSFILVNFYRAKLNNGLTLPYFVINSKFSGISQLSEVFRFEYRHILTD